MTAGSTATIELVVDPSHPAFAGHFPQRPIVPGALLLERALGALDGDACWTVAQAKFLSPVAPGERVTLEARAVGAGYALRVLAGADERVAMTASVARAEPSR